MKAKKMMQILALTVVMAMSGLALTGCGSDEEDTQTTNQSAENDAEDQEDHAKAQDSEEEDTDTAGGEGSFAYAGEYTWVDGDITYVVTVEENEDYEMQVTRQFDGFTATKYYAGPMKNIEGAHMATMPVFLSDLVYEGDAAPDDSAEVYEKMNELYQANRGETEESRMFYITIDKENQTFVCDEGQTLTLDPTEGYWLAADFAE